jgi:hypothetical protein
LDVENAKFFIVEVAATEAVMAGAAIKTVLHVIALGKVLAKRAISRVNRIAHFVAALAHRVPQGVNAAGNLPIRKTIHAVLKLRAVKAPITIYGVSESVGPITVFRVNVLRSLSWEFCPKGLEFF